MTKAKRLGLLLLAALAVLATTPARAESFASLSPELQAPRPFGFVIGDLIHHRIHIEVDSASPLKPDSVPPVGPINYWLELRDAEIKQTQTKGKTLYTIDLNYQTFYAPREVETLAIPGFRLSFEGSGKTEAVVQPWHFSMSVIRELSVLSGDGGNYMRPDDPPDLFDTTGPVSRLLILTAVLVLSVGLFAYYFGYLPFSRRGRIFNEALGDLERPAIGSDERERLKATLATVHNAFNQVYGRPLFYDGLEDFFTEHPGYRQVEPGMADFFKASIALFFSATEARPEPYSLDKAIELCRTCRAIERGIQ
ncbi:MAG: nonribosomal peptide synthetase MxaA [Methylococcales bacterium]